MEAKNSKLRNYFLGIGWFVLSLIVSNGNDLIQKQLGSNFHSIQLTFLRFFASTLILLPFVFYSGRKSLKTSRPGVHFMRGLLLFLGIAFFCHGLNVVPLAVVTTVNFTIPLFVLILALFFLKERVTLPRWIATLVGFAGIVVVFRPSETGFQLDALTLILASLCFASLDVINKKFVVKESLLSMLFYSSAITALLAAIPAYFVWTPASTADLLLILGLGCGANLILYCLLKAFAATDASALAPFRYVELLLSALTGYLFFGEVPAWGTWLGAAIIIPSTFYVIYSETKKDKPSEEKVLVEENA